MLKMVILRNYLKNRYYSSLYKQWSKFGLNSFYGEYNNVNNFIMVECNYKVINQILD